MLGNTSVSRPNFACGPLSSAGASLWRGISFRKHYKNSLRFLTALIYNDIHLESPNKAKIKKRLNRMIAFAFVY